MKLLELASRIPEGVLVGEGETEVSGVAYDSRKVKAGDLFVAVTGEDSDGRDFAMDAIAAGAAAVAAEGSPDPAWNCPSIQVCDGRIALALTSAAVEGDPSNHMLMAGITGTNGKTTTGFLLHDLLTRSLHRAGLIGTVVHDDGEGLTASTHTTPESADLQALLRRMADNGCRAVAMEVSSHGLAQHRTYGVQFDVAIFTNLTQDHLDYHGDMAGYFTAKKKLFTQTATRGGSRKSTLVINLDDKYGKQLVEAFRDVNDVQIVTYGMGFGCDFKATDVRSSTDGTEFKLFAKGREYLVRIPLVGQFNAYNALAALAGAQAMGLNLRESIGNLSKAPQVPGRLESVTEHSPFRVYVDYAHTPDALEKAIATLKGLGGRRLITVFGCGGDRDEGKRPQMGRVAVEGSDLTIVTTDNPRSEDPEKIIGEIVAGMPASARYTIVADRKEAIHQALEAAGSFDIILIAGKGHETYQEINGERFDFDDREVVKRHLGDLPSREEIREQREIEKAEHREENDRFRKGREGDEG